MEKCRVYRAKEGRQKMKDNRYIFTSERLGFRNFEESDLDEMLELNQDPQVMLFFPSVQDKITTKSFIERMQLEYSEYKYCYFAVELKTSSEFLGFIGISNQDYGDELGKFVDVGWRVKQSAWGNGYATEGAKQCLLYAKEELKLPKVYAVAPEINVNSIAVMEKIGMKKVREFEHPKLIDFPDIKDCVLYEINL